LLSTSVETPFFIGASAHIGLLPLSSRPSARAPVTRGPRCSASARGALRPQPRCVTRVRGFQVMGEGRALHRRGGLHACRSLCTRPSATPTGGEQGCDRRCSDAQSRIACRPYTYCISRRHVFGGKQLRLLEGSHRATHCAIMHGARGDTARACGTSTTPPSPARSARRTPTVVSWRASTADPRGGAPLRHHTTSRDIPGLQTGGATTPSLHMPRDARPARLSYFSPPGHGLATTRCSSEAIDMTAY
jgi:hypothetical protein